jgi:MATE family multidrug resistance protein
VVWFEREPIIRLYTNNSAVERIAALLIVWGAAFHLFDALQGVAFQTLRGYKVAHLPMWIYAISLWGIGIGGGYWIAYSHTPIAAPLGAVGFWSAAVVSLGTAAGFLVWLLLTVARQRVREQ